MSGVSDVGAIVPITSAQQQDGDTGGTEPNIRHWTEQTRNRAQFEHGDNEQTGAEFRNEDGTRKDCGKLSLDKNIRLASDFR